jgi:hypothetical protein
MDFTWVAQDDSNAIQNTIVDAKGDLIAATANDTPARLAVGNNGETLVADSSTSTGLRYQSNFAAGKNAVINGAFNVWQRGTSFAAGVYCADRFINDSDGTCTASQQTFTPGTAPVSGYEGTFFLRQARTASGTYQIVASKIEDVRTFANQTITLSFWAKADATVTNLPNISQNFGSGGSAQVTSTAGSQSITTSWTRFTYTVTLASISGKTIGTGSNIEIRPIRIVDGAAHTIDIWGVQLEAGSVATAFQTATGTIQGELAACQRYYFRQTNTDNAYGNVLQGFAASTTEIRFVMRFPVQLRATPTVFEWVGMRVTDYTNNFTVSAMGTGSQTPYSLQLEATVSGVTQFRPYTLQGNNSTTSYVGFGAEL